MLADLANYNHTYYTTAWIWIIGAGVAASRPECREQRCKQQQKKNSIKLARG